MNETTSLTCQTQCPTACPCPILLSIASSIAHEEDALACILNAECAKINRVIAASSDYEALIAIDTSVQATLERVIELEGILKTKYLTFVPFRKHLSPEYFSFHNPLFISVNKYSIVSQRILWYNNNNYRR